MADQQQIISARIQNRRGLRQNLPQPLLPGELGLATDTGQLFIGSDPLDPASITAPIIEIYNDFITDTISNEAIENSYVAVANQLIGTDPEVPAQFFVNTTTGAEAEISGSVLVGGPIETIVVEDGGSGYSGASVFSVRDRAPGSTASGAIVSATLSAGTIVSIGISAPGAGYIDPVIEVDRTGTGTFEDIDGIMVSALRGQVDSVTVDNPGNSYSIGDTVGITHPYGESAEASVDQISSVDAIVVDNGGSGYSSATITITDATGPGTGATATAVIVDDEVSSVIVTNSGSGYETPVVKITGDGSGATATALGPIGNISVSLSGRNYQPVKYGYVIRVKAQEYSYIVNGFGDTETAVAVPNINNNPDISSATEVMFTPDYDRISDNYTGHEWVFIAYKRPLGETLPDLTFSYVEDISVDETSQNVITESFTDVHLIPFPYAATPFDNDPFYSFVGKTLDMSVQFPGDEEYNTADTAALAQAINWSFNNGVSGFEYINDGAITDQGITGATGRGTSIVTVAQNIEIKTDRGNEYNTEIATLVRELRATVEVPNNEEFDSGLEYRFPNPQITVEDNILVQSLLSNSGSGYIFPVVENNGVPLTDGLDNTVINLGVNRSITDINVTEEAYGFDLDNPPVVEIQDSPLGSGHSFSFNVYDGVIAGVTVDNPGIGYTEADYKLYCAKSNAADPVDFDIVVANGRVTSVVVNDGGRNYISPRMFIYDKPIWNKPDGSVVFGSLGVNEKLIPVLAVSEIKIEDDFTIPEPSGAGVVEIVNADFYNTSLGLGAVSQPSITVNSSGGNISSLVIDDAGGNFTVDESLGDTIVYNKEEAYDATTNPKPYVTIDGIEVPGLSVKFKIVDVLLADNSTIASSIGSDLSPTTTNTWIVDVKGQPTVYAEADVEVSNNMITDVVVTREGGGYYVPTVLVTGPGTGASARPEVRNGVISSVDVDNPGQYYSLETFSSNGQAFAYAEVNGSGEITNIILSGKGAGYTRAPTVTITDDFGTGASATADVTDGNGTLLGFIRKIDIVNPGINYSSSPRITISEPNTNLDVIINQETGEIEKVDVINGGAGYFTGQGSGATATAIISGGQVTDVVVTNGGSGYIAAPYVFLDEGADYDDFATGTAIVKGGKVVDVVVDYGGAGYTSAPDVGFDDFRFSARLDIDTNGPGTGATARAVVTGIVDRIIVDNGGSGYTDPSVTISNANGSGATATVTQSEGSIDSITVTNRGSGYTESPIVTISDPTGIGASATAIVGGVIEDIVVEEGGDRYINPSVIVFPSPQLEYPGPVNNFPSGKVAFAEADPVFGVITSSTVLPDNFKLPIGYELTINDAYGDFGGTYEGGTGASITPIIADGVITNVEFPTSRDYGQGYISNPDITVSSIAGNGARFSATPSNNKITSVDIISGGTGYPAGTFQIDTINPAAPLPELYLSFSAPDGLRSTGIWYDLDEADAFTIRYSIKNNTNIRKGELSVAAIGNDYIIDDKFSALTNDSDPLSLVFIPEVDTINNIIEIKYSARTLPSEDVNPTSLSTNTLRWKNF